MIIATITALILIFGGGSLEFYLTNLKGPVKEHVQDKARQEIIIDAGKALAAELAGFEEEINEHFEDLVEVHRAYDSTASDFDEATAKLLADQKKLSRMVLDARDTMHEQMTREEWEAVFQEEE